MNTEFLIKSLYNSKAFVSTPPSVFNGIFLIKKTDFDPPNNDHLGTTTTFYWSQRWSLCTGLTVQVSLAIHGGYVPGR
jgi:hypothetical protein